MTRIRPSSQTSLSSTLLFALPFSALVVACASAPADHAADARPEMPVTAASPSATVAAVPSTAPSAVAKGETSCMMLWVCGCNLGCASIGVPEKVLHAGLRATMLSGPMTGETGIVDHAPKKGGGDVLALSDRDHAAACRADRASPFIGFACATRDSGDVNAQACAAGCGPR